MKLGATAQHRALRVHDGPREVLRLELQDVLEILGMPYTGPGVASCIRCMDKVLAKHLFRAAGIPTPDWVAFNSTAFRELGAADALEEIEARLGFPLVVKPAAQGSPLGVRLAGSRDDVPEALVSAFSYDDRVRPSGRSHRTRTSPWDAPVSRASI